MVTGLLRYIYIYMYIHTPTYIYIWGWGDIMLLKCSEMIHGGENIQSYMEKLVRVRVRL